MSYGGSGGGRYHSPLTGLGSSSLYSPSSSLHMPSSGSSSLHMPSSGSSSLHLPSSLSRRDAHSPSRSLLSTGQYPLQSSYSSASIPTTGSSLYGGLSNLGLSRSPTGRSSPYTSSTPSSLLELPGISSGSRSPRSPRSLSPNPGYNRYKPTSLSGSPSAGLKTYTPSTQSSLGPSGYSLSGSRSTSTLAPTTSARRVQPISAASSSDRYRSRYGSSGSLQDGKDSRLSDRSRTASQTSLNSSTSSLNEDGEKDYKKLYTEVKEENDRLKMKLKKTDEELVYAKGQLDKLMQNNKNSLSDVEKRDRRAIERRLSEMEEESKEMERLLADNQRLRDENGALIRVISKLSK